MRAFIADYVCLGVAMGMEKPRWLKDGDTVEVRIEKIGTLKHTIAFE